MEWMKVNKMLVKIVLMKEDKLFVYVNTHMFKKFL